FPGRRLACAFEALREEQVAQRLERFVPRAERIRRAPQAERDEILVAAADAAEGIVVEAGPDVQAVLLDARAHGQVPPARALAAETPAELIDGDLVAVPPRRISRH